MNIKKPIINFHPYSGIHSPGLQERWSSQSRNTRDVVFSPGLQERWYSQLKSNMEAVFIVKSQEWTFLTHIDTFQQPLDASLIQHLTFDYNCEYLLGWETGGEAGYGISLGWGGEEGRREGGEGRGRERGLRMMNEMLENWNR